MSFRRSLASRRDPDKDPDGDHHGQADVHVMAVANRLCSVLAQFQKRRFDLALLSDAYPLLFPQELDYPRLEIMEWAEPLLTFLIMCDVPINQRWLATGWMVPNNRFTTLLRQANVYYRYEPSLLQCDASSMETLTQFGFAPGYKSREFTSFKYPGLRITYLHYALMYCGQPGLFREYDGFDKVTGLAKGADSTLLHGETILHLAIRWNLYLHLRYIITHDQAIAPLVNHQNSQG